MKSILVVLLFICGIANASELSDEKRDEIIKSVQKFDKDCPQFGKSKTVSAVNVKNKTSQHIDKKELTDFIAEHFDIAIDPKSHFVLDTTLSSSEVELNKVKTTTYTFNFRLLEKSKTVCDKHYTTEFKSE